MIEKIKQSIASLFFIAISLITGFLVVNASVSSEIRRECLNETSSVMNEKLKKIHKEQCGMLLPHRFFS